MKVLYTLQPSSAATDSLNNFSLLADDTSLAYNQYNMVIIETSIFTRQVTSLLTEDEYQRLQIALTDRPEAGPIIPGSGGLRKLRWSASGKGKRGGARIVYYWAVPDDQILMLFIYAKGERDDLTPQQIALLRQIVEEEYK